MLTSIVPELDIPLESIRLSAEVVAALLPKCPNCGADVKQNSVFCSECGEKL